MKVADITAEQLSDYEEKLSAIRSSAGNAFKTLALEQDLLKLGEEARKSAIYHAANKAVSHLSDAAGSIACDFFDAHVTSAAPSEIAPLPKFIKRRLYEHIEKYAKTHKLGDDEFMRLVAEEVGGEVVQHANRTTVHNAAKNDVRYARVPFGNSCAFCLMLASRGFVYHSATTAGEDKGHYHGNCRCKIVAGKEGTEIEGYNPEALNRRMQQIAEELDITNFNWEDYMSDKAMQDLLQREIRLRDKDWLLNGKVPEVDYSNNPRENYGIRKVENNDYSKENFETAKNEWRDLFVHDTLARNGYSVAANADIMRGGSTNIDLFVAGLKAEVKSPEAEYIASAKDPFKFVQRNVEKARNQFKADGEENKGIVFSNFYTGYEDNLEEKVLERFTREAKRNHFQNAWFISKNGQLKKVI